MKIVFTLIFFTTILGGFNFCFAQEAATSSRVKDVMVLEFGEYQATYNKSETVEESGTNYYLDEAMVASTFDTDGDGEIDLWLKYDDEGLLAVEAMDADGDGVPEIITELEEDGEVVDQALPEFELEEVNLPENPNPNKTQAAESEQNEIPERFILNPPPEDSGRGLGYYLEWLGAAVVVGMVFWIARRRYNKKTPSKT